MYMYMYMPIMHEIVVLSYLHYDMYDIGLIDYMMNVLLDMHVVG